MNSEESESTRFSKQKVKSVLLEALKKAQEKQVEALNTEDTIKIQLTQTEVTLYKNLLVKLELIPEGVFIG